MRIDEFWNDLARYGIDVPAEVRQQFGLAHNQERVLIRPPAANNKARVLEAGTSVPATYVARTLGITVRQVRKYRTLLRG
jgi:hypothetical protein